jgi:hypothetical protein
VSLEGGAPRARTRGAECLYLPKGCPTRARAWEGPIGGGEQAGNNPGHMSVRTYPPIFVAGDSRLLLRLPPRLSPQCQVTTTENAITTLPGVDDAVSANRLC